MHRSVVRNPNLLGFGDQRSNTARNPMQISFSHLPEKKNTGRVPTVVSSRAPSTIANPTKTAIFRSTESIASFYEIQKVNNEQVVQKPSQIRFCNPLIDLMDSACTIAFVASNFNFYSVMLQSNREFIKKGVVDVSNAFFSFKLANLKISEKPFGKVQSFADFSRFLGLSVSGPHDIDILDSMETIVQAQFEADKTGDVIFAIETSKVPPDVIEAKSQAVEKATNGETSLAIKYKPRWIIVKQDGLFTPAIVRENGEVDVIYRCKDNNHFGSIRSILYSGLQISFICYSMRPYECPPVMICE